MKPSRRQKGTRRNVTFSNVVTVRPNGRLSSSWSVLFCCCFVVAPFSGGQERKAIATIRPL